MPFPRSISVVVTPPTVELPTATQLVVPVQDTPMTATAVAPLGVGLATIDQAEPFQRSMSTCEAELFADVPTATQLDAVAQEMPAKCATTSWAGTGMSTIDQLVPFQRSTSGCSLQHVVEVELPTAKQFVVLVQETAASVLSDPDGSGPVEVVQAVPFQYSIRTCCLSKVVNSVPTAKQLVGVAHETELKS